MTKVFSLQLSTKEYNMLEKAAKAQDRSKGYIIRQCMNQYLEDYIDIKNTQKILKDINSGKMKTKKWEDIKKDLC